MTYRHTQQRNIRYKLYRGPQATLCASTSVSRSRLSGLCRGTTLGKTGSGCIVLVRTSRRLLPEHPLWGCGCPSTVRSGMEIFQLAKTVRRVLRRVERTPVQVTRRCGMAVFKGDSLPWTVGRYEMRYHHDGKYNVLALEGPIEIYGACPSFVFSPPRFAKLYKSVSSGPPGKSGF